MIPTQRDPQNQLTMAAIAHLVAAQYARERYDMALSCALVVHEDGDGRDISGIYRNHFPQQAKNELRFYARNISEQTHSAVACWHKAGRRIDTLRPFMEQYRQLPNGKRSYY